MQDLIQLLGGQPPRVPVVTVSRADDDPAALRAWRVLRERAFVDRLGLFEGSDLDAADADPATVVLVATVLGEVVGGVRLHPVAGTDPALGWWQGGRLVCSPSPARGVGSALVRAACAVAEAAGVLRFEATVIEANAGLFDRSGWERVRPVEVRGAPHQLMRWPVERVAALVQATKSELGPLLADVRPGGDGWVGDDAAPVPGSDGVASVDAILPAMVARDPVWAGWCGILVGAGDLAAMGAVPRGVLGALGAPTAAHAAQVLHGLRAASDAFALPILGGHTQLGVPASLAVTALGSTSRPVPSGGGRPGHDVRLTVDLGGGWRPGYQLRQWDSTSTRTRGELSAMLSVVARGAPAAAKDVSMAGLVGTLGMLAEASGCGAELDVATVPRPAGVPMGDWATCFPGTGLLSADEPGRAWPDAGPAATAVCGRLTTGRGVRLRWPDGEVTTMLSGNVTGMGPAGG
jgi:putative N-acetyltransferase (TIGR04045 family)